MDNELAASTQDSWKMKVLLVGGLVGLASGVAAAYLLVQRAEKAGEQPLLSSSEGVKLGILVFGLLRQVAQLGEGK